MQNESRRSIVQQGAPVTPGRPHHLGHSSQVWGTGPSYNYSVLRGVWSCLACLACLVALESGAAAASGSQPNGRARGDFAVLAPATVPPRIAECHETLGYGNDGAGGPLFCGNGRLNVTAWAAYARLAGSNAPILRLGRHATLAQIKKALCTPQPGDNPIGADEYALARAYYGLRDFDALQWMARGNCVPLKDRG